ncbi:PKD domain-containing protein [Chryseobacterium salviniae]|uniref:PKD domain-containing protein n=1 Tax=Chryseobacterium salviniae TaxID=3101750 RepID=A0ABU6HNL2_9FLAO|nr:hypothetical protein [Chryseobacterium sp. T9W2-O]MEC3874304.1 hypothetical protein [Chryseobacterium sp. T9W2-O]
MNNQLSNISTQYRKFTKGQYVKHTQFNEFLDFFEDQDRLTRILLQGVGIVCGFRPELIYTNRILSGIRLSQGAAVTTDGDLLTLSDTNKLSEDLYVSDLKTIEIQNKEYTHFKVYEDSKGKYGPFREDNGAGKQIELWELATEKDADSDFQPIARLAGLESKYLLLYLEAYEKIIKPCRGVDCDNHGVQQIRNLKVLVTTSEGITNILGKNFIPESVNEIPKHKRLDRVQSHPLFIDDILKYGKQKRVILEKLIAEQGTDAQFSASDIKNLYLDTLADNDYAKVIFDKINFIAQLMGLPVANHGDFKDTLESFLIQDAGFQYAYDAVKDLADTYYEIIKLLPKALTVNLPDLNSFPKHIMLGKLIPVKQLDFSRHQFYNSSVLDLEKNLPKLQLLISRFVQQAKEFRNFTVADGSAQITITPSQKFGDLSGKAVPFYYKISDEFLKTWNFNKTANRSYRDNLTSNNALSLEIHIQEPLSFNIDKHSFYNIEGHQGMHYRQAFQMLNQINDEKQLGFDVMMLSMEELIDNKDLFKAYFNEYVEQHPGLEHKHGVEKGGTFIIVYQSSENPVVFADFSLPYICCTPKVDVKLTLPTDVICAKSGSIPFTVYPMNGDVEAAVTSGLSGGVEKIADGQYVFNPAKVSPQLYDKPIAFTVNGKATPCTIKVIKESDVRIDVTSVIYPTAGSNETKVNFKVSGTGFTAYDYNWDLLQNSNFVNLKPDGEGNVSYTYYDLNPAEIPVITVNVNSNGCTQTVMIRNWYDGPVTVIDGISFPQGNCCEGRVPVITADAGGNRSFPFGVDSFVLEGNGWGAQSLYYSWTQVLGPSVTLTDINKPSLKVNNVIMGTYEFMLTVIDSVSGAFATDLAQVHFIDK